MIQKEIIAIIAKRLNKDPEQLNLNEPMIRMDPRDRAKLKALVLVDIILELEEKYKVNFPDCLMYSLKTPQAIIDFLLPILISKK